ncbi:MAG: sulfotransferase [Wenzhouxiangellaceae bacterium]|nr:sulfotransferase [Wenzhouxiangellaceae bacterium]
MQEPTPTWNHPLLGADVATLLRLFAQHPIALRLWPRALAFLGAAVGRAPLSLAERAWVAARRDPLPDMPPPVFILGHWRSGTTHLFNLMSRDPRFAWPDPIATGMPWNFLLLGRALRSALVRALPESRLIDNVAVTPDSPQEDEIALASMQPLSYYHALYFPQAFETEFERGLFPAADDAGLARRRRRLEQYSRKLLLAGRGNQLLVKNPAWTGQVAWLRSIWPEARFIHIHRSPFDVFDSTRNFYRKLLPAYALQPFDLERIEPWIFDAFTRMFERMYTDVADLGSDRFVEIRYADLEQEPVDVVRHIYAQLGLGRFEALEPTLVDYLAGIRGYVKNPRRFDAADLDRVEHHWGRWLERWDYTRP